MDIPWNRLSSAAVEIKIKDVYLVFRLEGFSDLGLEEKLEENGKYLLIKNYVEHILRKSEEMGG